MDLDDSRGLDPGPEDVLLRRLVVLGAQALQVVQEAGRERVSLKKCFHIDLSLCKYSNKTSKRERYDNDFFRSLARVTSKLFSLTKQNRKCSFAAENKTTTFAPSN